MVLYNPTKKNYLCIKKQLNHALFFKYCCILVYILNKYDQIYYFSSYNDKKILK
jgi:hypothetical protein